MELSAFINDEDITDCEWEIEDLDGETTSSDSNDSWVPTKRERRPRNARSSHKLDYLDDVLSGSESEHLEHQSSDDNWEPEKKVRNTRKSSVQIIDEIDDQTAADVQHYESKKDGTHVDTAVKEPEQGAAKKKKVWPKKYNRGPFICAYCSRQFRGLLDLTRHERIHTNEKPLVCDQCGRGFNCETGLKSHLVVHSTLKPFSCSQCDMKFSKQHYLKNHLAKHSSEKPFVCKFCGFRVKYRSSLRNHLRTHRTEKNFACEICGKKFLTEVLCRMHQGRHADPKNRVNRIPKEGQRRQRSRRRASRTVHVEQHSQTMTVTCVSHNKTNVVNSQPMASFNNQPLMNNTLLVPHRPLGIATVFPSVGPNILLPSQTLLPLRGPVPANSPMMNHARGPVMASTILTEFSRAVGSTPTLQPHLGHGMSLVIPKIRSNNVQTPPPAVLQNSLQPQMPLPIGSNTSPLLYQSLSGAIYCGVPVSASAIRNVTPTVNPIPVTPGSTQIVPPGQIQLIPSAVAGSSKLIAVPVKSNPMQGVPTSLPSNTALTAQMIGPPAVAQPVLSRSVLAVVSQSSCSSEASSGNAQKETLPLSSNTVPEMPTSTPISLLNSTSSTTSPDSTRMTSPMEGLLSTVNAVLPGATPTGQLADTLTPAGAMQLNTNTVSLATSSAPVNPLVNTNLTLSPVTFPSSANARPLSKSVVPQNVDSLTAPLGNTSVTAAASSMSTKSVQLIGKSTRELQTVKAELPVPVTSTQMTSMSSGNEAWAVTSNKVPSELETAASVSPTLADEFSIDAEPLTSNSAPVVPPTFSSLKAPPLDDIQLTPPVNIIAPIETSKVPLDDSNVTKPPVSALPLTDNADENSLVTDINSSEKRHKLFLANNILTSQDLTSYSTEVSHSTEFRCESVLQTTTSTPASSSTCMYLNSTCTDEAQLTSPSSSGCTLPLSAMVNPSSTSPLQVMPNSAVQMKVNNIELIPHNKEHAPTLCSMNSSTIASSLETVESARDAMTSKLQTDVNENIVKGARPSAVSMFGISQENSALKPALLSSSEMRSLPTTQSNHCVVMPHHNNSSTQPVLSSLNDSVPTSSLLTSKVISPPSLLHTPSNISSFRKTPRPVSRDGSHLTLPPVPPLTKIVTTYSSQPMASSCVLTSQSAPKSVVEVTPKMPATDTHRIEKRLLPPSWSDSTVTPSLSPSEGSNTPPTSIDTLSEGPLLTSSTQPLGTLPEVNGPAQNVVVLLDSGQMKPLRSFNSSISLPVPASHNINPAKVNRASVGSTSPGDPPSSYSLMSNAVSDTSTLTAGVSSTVVGTFTSTISTSTISTAAASTASNTTKIFTSNMVSTILPTVESSVTQANATNRIAFTHPTKTSTVAPSVDTPTVTQPSTYIARLDTSTLETLPNYEDAVYFTYSPLMVIKTPFGPGSDNVMVKQSIRR